MSRTQSEWDYIPKELDVGTIVQVYKEGYSYLLEFMDKKGDTKGLVDMVLLSRNTFTKNYVWEETP